VTDADIRRPADAQPLVHSDPPAEGAPHHVAIIMDGNRRWARNQNLDELAGHVAGTEALRVVLKHVVQIGIPHLTVYAFSRENWARSDKEVAQLFNLLAKVINDETPELFKQGVAVRFLGRLAELPEQAQERIAAACAKTVGGTKLQLGVAFNYGSRTEMVDAVRSIVAAGTSPQSIDERTITAALYTAGTPDPDLVIRTGGEERLSNFLLWQSAYAEIVTTPTLWPDFGAADLDAAIATYAQRIRRFGR
jgi:undecaprenyl diphosphate synthase